MKRKRFFTLVELLVVLFIIGILSGMVFPSFGKARMRAKYVNWLAYNNGLNHDSDTVINFNFETAPYEIIKDGTTSEAFKNAAVACDAEKFDSSKYYGTMKNSAEWVKGGGRWPFKGAVQFDGREAFVEIASSYAVDFNPSKDNFTVMMWVNFYSELNQAVFSKGEKTNSLQYGTYLSKNNIEAIVGSSDQSWGRPEIETLRWYHLALVNDSSKGYTVYINGKTAEDPKSKKVKDADGVTMPNAKLIMGALVVPGKTIVIKNKGKGKGKGKPVIIIKKESDKVSDAFRGRIDEFVVVKRAVSSREVSKHYLAGNPY